MELTKEEYEKRKKTTDGMEMFYALGSPGKEFPSDLKEACDKYLSGEVNEEEVDDMLKAIEQAIFDKYK